MSIRRSLASPKVLGAPLVLAAAVVVLLPGACASGEADDDAAETGSEVAAITNYKDGRWPVAPIYYYIDEEGTAPLHGSHCNQGDGEPLASEYVSGVDGGVVRAAIKKLMDQTPLEYVELTSPPTTFNCYPVLVFTHWSEDYAFGTPPADSYTSSDFQSCVYLPDEVYGSSGLQHEIGHTLGMMHEHQRPTAALVRDLTCVPADLQKYVNADATPSTAWAPYDSKSVMHYWSKSVYDATLPDCAGCTSASCLHPVVSSLLGDWIPYNDGLSAQDINALTTWYEKPLAVPQNNSKLGSAMVTGDFDKDGYADLAVGAPGAASGKVFLYKGTESGLTAWKTLMVADFISDGALPHNDDKFGASLAVGDANQDGTMDLVVGAPGYVVGSTGSGAVFLYHGHSDLNDRVGPTAHKWWTESDANGQTTASSFGAAVAFGQFDGSHSFIAVGAPNKTSPGQFGWVGAGAVFVVRTGNETWYRIDPPTPAANMHFGSALEVTDFDDAFGFDLVVGAPATGTTSPGQVLLYHGSPLAYFGALSDPNPDPGEEFGAALESGHVTAQTAYDLVVGVPGKASSAGRVFVYPQLSSGAGYDISKKQILTGGAFATPPAPGDRFGASLATGAMRNALNMLLRIDDLAVGAPGGNAVYLFKGDTSGPTKWWRKTQQPDAFGTSSTDGYGTAVAIGGFADVAMDLYEINDDYADLAVGAPGRNAPTTKAGAFQVYLGDGDNEVYEETYGPGTASGPSAPTGCGN